MGGQNIYTFSHLYGCAQTRVSFVLLCTDEKYLMGDKFKRQPTVCCLDIDIEGSDLGQLSVLSKHELKRVQVGIGLP